MAYVPAQKPSETKNSFSFNLLFYLDLYGIEFYPAMLGRAFCFIPPTDSY